MSTLKQDERNQQILRELIQLPGNRKCMDCTAKGPVAAVIDFGTFVCQTCSGIHREFGHRIKMISMATFKPEEIEKLRRIGNENARRIWLAKWSPSDFPEPDPTRHKAIREFIHAKYIAKRWYDAAARDAVEGRKGGSPPPATTTTAHHQHQAEQAKHTTATTMSVPVPALARPPEAASETRARRPSATIPVQPQQASQQPQHGFGDDLFGPPIAAPPAAPATAQAAAPTDSTAGALFGAPAEPTSLAAQQASEQKKKDDIMSRFAMAQSTPAAGGAAGMGMGMGFGMGMGMGAPSGATAAFPGMQMPSGPFGVAPMPTTPFGMSTPAMGTAGFPAGGMGAAPAGPFGSAQPQPQQQQMGATAGPFGGYGGAMGGMRAAPSGPFGMQQMGGGMPGTMAGPFGATQPQTMGGMASTAGPFGSAQPQPQQMGATAGPFGGYGGAMGGMQGYGSGMGMMPQQQAPAQQQQQAFGGFATSAPAAPPATAAKPVAPSPFADLVPSFGSAATTSPSSSSSNPFGTGISTAKPASTTGGNASLFFM